MGQTFKAGDRVLPPVERAEYSWWRCQADGYVVREDRFGGLYVIDSHGDRHFMVGDDGWRLTASSSTPAALPEPFTHMVLSAIDNEQYLNPLDVLEALGYRVETITTIVPSTNR